MKKLLLTVLSVGVMAHRGNSPRACGGGVQGGPGSVEVRNGTWPISLERTTDRPGVSFSLIFRDQEVMNDQVLDTLDFADAEQLHYFGAALTALKNGHNGDAAKFKEYSITRADRKYAGGVWYILRPQYGSTSFQQPEADIIVKAVKQW